jgi:hypothetical protein
MAKVNKTTDPAEAALSAIEEALNGRATGTDGGAVRPKLPKVKLPKMADAADVNLASLEQAIGVAPARSGEPAADTPMRQTTS